MLRCQKELNVGLTWHATSTHSNFNCVLKWCEWLKFAATLAVLFESVGNKLSHIYALLSFMFQSAKIFGGRIENFAWASSELADSVVQLPSIKLVHQNSNQQNSGLDRLLSTSSTSILGHASPSSPQLSAETLLRTKCDMALLLHLDSRLPAIIILCS